MQFSTLSRAVTDEKRGDVREKMKMLVMNSRSAIALSCTLSKRWKANTAPGALMWYVRRRGLVRPNVLPSAFLRMRIMSW